MPKKTLTQLGRNLNRRLREGRKKYVTVKRNHAKRILLQVIETSPVDTGKLVSNWQVGIGSPDAPVREAFNEGAKGDAKAESNRARAYAEGAAVIDTAREEDDIFISNNTPYLQYNTDRITFDDSPDDLIFVEGNF